MEWITYKKHWRWFVRTDGYVEIISPTMHEGTGDFTDKRELYVEFKELTEKILVNGYKGWISDTLITLPNIMRMFAKMGARPYAINIGQDNMDKIFFIMEVR
jgi:hypothetical protein